MARLLRIGVWAGLVLSWLFMLLYAWAAFATVPSPERLEQSHMTRIPTLATMLRLLVRSGVELGVLLALLWPWRARWFALRMITAAFLLGVYFIVTTPLTLTAVEWVHRRWLAGVTVGLLVSFVILVAATLARRLQSHARTAT